MFHHLHLSVAQHEGHHKPGQYVYTQWEKWKSDLQVNVCNVDMNNWEYNALECSLSRDLNFIVTREIHFTKIVHGKKTINGITFDPSILYVHHKTSLSSARRGGYIYIYIKCLMS
jgi:hypothetical protein